MALVEDEGHFPSGAFSWEVRTHGTPSDSTTNSLASNKPFQSPNCSSRAPNSEVPPPAARALSMRTLTAPLVLSFRSVNAKVKFPRSAKVKFPSFWCFGGEPAQSSVRVSFLGRPRFFGGGGGVIGAFVRTCSGMRSACFLSR